MRRIIAGLVCGLLGLLWMFYYLGIWEILQRRTWQESLIGICVPVIFWGLICAAVWLVYSGAVQRRPKGKIPGMTFDEKTGNVGIGSPTKGYDWPPPHNLPPVTDIPKMPRSE